MSHSALLLHNGSWPRYSIQLNKAEIVTEAAGLRRGGSEEGS